MMEARGDKRAAMAGWTGSGREVGGRVVLASGRRLLDELRPQILIRQQLIKICDGAR
jgi:hypothetical protein